MLAKDLRKEDYKMKISKKEASTLMKAKINAEIDYTGKRVSVNGSIFGTAALAAIIENKILESTGMSRQEFEDLKADALNVVKKIEDKCNETN